MASSPTSATACSSRGQDEEREYQQRHKAELESIEERLARLLGRKAAREELERLRAQEASRTPRTHEELERLREREASRAHEITRERLNEALERPRSTDREGPTHDEDYERDDEVRRHKDRGHGWGL